MSFQNNCTGARRRHLMAGVGVVAVGLSVTSVAFACTVFIGQGVLKGDARDADGHKREVTVVGDARGMGYCNPAPGVGEEIGAMAPGSGHTYVNKVDSRVSLTLSPTTECVDNSGSAHWGGQLPDGAYNVNFQQGPAFSNTSDDTRTWLLDCMYSSEDTARFQGMEFPRAWATAVKLGEINVVAGRADKRFDLGSALISNGPGDEAGLCIANRRGTFTDTRGVSSDLGLAIVGLQIPLTVL